MIAPLSLNKLLLGKNNESMALVLLCFECDVDFYGFRRLLDGHLVNHKLSIIRFIIIVLITIMIGNVY